MYRGLRVKFWEDFPEEVVFELCGERRGLRPCSNLDLRHCSSFFAGARVPEKGRQAGEGRGLGVGGELPFPLGVFVPNNGVPLSFLEGLSALAMRFPNGAATLFHIQDIFKPLILPWSDSNQTVLTSTGLLIPTWELHGGTWRCTAGFRLGLLLCSDSYCEGEKLEGGAEKPK